MRYIFLYDYLRTSVPDRTVNRLCGSGMHAVELAMQAAGSGQGEL